MEIDYINGYKTDKIFGTSKYQNEIHKRLDINLNKIEYESLTHIAANLYNSIFPPKSNDGVFPAQKTGSLSKSSKFNKFVYWGRKTSIYIDRYRYQLIVKNKVKNDNIKHLTNQELAYLLDSIKLNKSIVTCHDLIPWVYEKNRSMVWKNNIKGLKKAEKIITISKFSKNEIMKQLNYPEERISVVYCAVDHDLYFRNRNREILKRFNIEDEKIVLYVGAETQRMNLDKLIKSFAKLKKKLPHIKLLKIGEPQKVGVREKLIELINKLNLEKDVIFVGYVSEEDLPEWYNAADLLVYPCAYAGFGLPPLEAMACGTPVITSNTTSLPEVVGDAGIMVDPDDIDKLAEKMYEVLTNDSLAEDMSKKGLKRAKMFNWDESAEKTLKIYKELEGDQH
ncbi:MAG: glycosyltransferase family 1 protein [Methanobacteriaceae archaeon]|jgi:glycosyltransferase involved in cell wall biosynthesis